MAESLRFYLRNREKGIDGKNIVMGLIADQNHAPSRQPLVPLPQSGYDLFDGGEKPGVALRSARILLLAAAWSNRVITRWISTGFTTEKRRWLPVK